MTSKWRSALAGAVAALGLAVLAGPAGAQGQVFRLIVSDLEAPLVPNSVIDLAESLGYFEREGVNVELVRVQQTPSIVAALQAGEGEMGNIAVSDALQLVARGQFQLVAVASPNKSLPYLIATRDTITEPKALEGAAFGIGRIGSLDHSLTRRVFEQIGVNPDAVNYVPVGQPAVRLQALAANQGIQATTVSIGTWLALPDRAGLHVLVSPEEYYAAAPVVNKVNVVSPETLANRRADIDGVLRAIIKISRDIAADPKIWVDGMATLRPDVSRATLEQLAEQFSGSAESWSTNGGMSRAALEATVEFNYSSPDFEGVPRIELSQWVDFGPLDGVLAELGTDPELDPADR
jgi:NitT/TauT family transport system substrate-binding protein